MDDSEIDSILQAYRNGATADMLRSKSAETWSVWWTVPPCSPAALERAGQQMTRSRAEAVWHVRRAVLKSKDERESSVVIFTELPTELQQVFMLSDGRVVQTTRCLIDGSLAALKQAFVPAR
jgi:hypothetical protein